MPSEHNEMNFVYIIILQNGKFTQIQVELRILINIFSSLDHLGNGQHEVNQNGKVAIQA